MIKIPTSVECDKRLTKDFCGSIFTIAFGKKKSQKRQWGEKFFCEGSSFFVLLIKLFLLIKRQLIAKHNLIKKGRERYGQFDRQVAGRTAV